MQNKPVTPQRAYYERTAEHYDAMHVSDLDEHGTALALFSGLARLAQARTVLDVGAGTGRAITLLGQLLPDVQVTGVEPVEALREVGHRRGIDPACLIDGDALALPFADDAFDFVIETGVLHHIPAPRRAVEEMVRVARKGVMISDSNKLGQGSGMTRLVKNAIAAMGLWDALIWATTKGKMAKYSEGDGVFYSYSVFDDLEAVKRKFPKVHLFNTVPMPSANIKTGAGQMAVIALKD